jgi:hypothetical protein
MVWRLHRYLVHAVNALSTVAGNNYPYQGAVIYVYCMYSICICIVHFRSSSDQGPKANKIPLSSVAQSTEDATHPPRSLEVLHS